MIYYAHYFEYIFFLKSVLYIFWSRAFIVVFDGDNNFKKCPYHLQYPVTPQG